MNKLKLRVVNTNVMILIFILCCLRMYSSIHPIFKLYKDEEIALEKTKETKDKFNISEEKLKLLGKEDYLQRQIRIQYHLSKDDEILFIFPKEKDVI